VTEVYTADSLEDRQIVELISKGSIGVIPTDTVYGLVCLAKSKSSVERLYHVKNREGKPGTLIASSIEQLAELGLKTRYMKAVEHLWPGPISVVIPCFGQLDYLHLGMNSLAVRIPDKPDLQNLLAVTGVLQTSSANIAQQPPATTLDEAKSYFGNKVDFYVDGGDLSEATESTVVRIVDDAIEVLRQGAVKIDENGRITT
jgi:L-threonylcarbamoyladenylate synthase